MSTNLTATPAPVAKTPASSPAPKSFLREGDSENVRAAIAAAEAEERAQLSGDNETLDTEAETSERPENIPEKFWKDGKLDSDALLKSYSELEKKRGEAKPEGAEEVTTQDAAAKDIAESTGIDFAKYTDEFADNGFSLKEGSRTEILGKLEKGLGMSKEDSTALLDGYLDGLTMRSTAASSQYETDVKSVVSGGDTEYKAMIDWARDNLTSEEIKEFDTDVNSGSAKLAKFAVKDLLGRFKANAEPALITGKTAAAKGGDSYASRGQMIRDMQDARYEKDPVYRSEVDSKIDRSVGNF